MACMHIFSPSKEVVNGAGNLVDDALALLLLHHKVVGLRLVEQEDFNILLQSMFHSRPELIDGHGFKANVGDHIEYLFFSWFVSQVACF
jgi:hypothetical protein